MSNPYFATNLDNALTILNKKAWAPSLTELAQKFRFIPEDVPAFGDELFNALWSWSEATKTDYELPLTFLFAIRFSKFEAWTFRFSQATPHRKHYLNPLTQDADDFIHADISQSSTAFPAEDIIRRWAGDHLV